MFCVKCGTKLPDEANFCWKCGQPQKDDKTKTVKQSQPVLGELKIVLQLDVRKKKAFIFSYLDKTPPYELFVELTDAATKKTLYSKKILSNTIERYRYSDGDGRVWFQYSLFKESADSFAAPISMSPSRSSGVHYESARQEILACLAELENQGWAVSMVGNQLGGIRDKLNIPAPKTEGTVRHVVYSVIVHRHQ